MEALGGVAERGDRLGRGAGRVERVGALDDFLVVGVAVLVAVGGGWVGAVGVDLVAVAEAVGIAVGVGRAGALRALGSIVESIVVGVGIEGVGARRLLIGIAEAVSIGIRVSIAQGGEVIGEAKLPAVVESVAIVVTAGRDPVDVYVEGEAGVDVDRSGLEGARLQRGVAAACGERGRPAAEGRGVAAAPVRLQVLGSAGRHRAVDDDGDGLQAGAVVGVPGPGEVQLAAIELLLAQLDARRGYRVAAVAGGAQYHGIGMLVDDGIADRAAAGLPDELAAGVVDAVLGSGIEVDGDGKGRIEAIDLGHTTDGSVVVGRQPVVACAQGVEDLVRRIRQGLYIYGLRGVEREYRKADEGRGLP